MHPTRTVFAVSFVTTGLQGGYAACAPPTTREQSSQWDMTNFCLCSTIPVAAAFHPLLWLPCSSLSPQRMVEHSWRGKRHLF